MNKFTIVITDIPNREKVIAEIWYGEELFAILNQEHKELEIELYPHSKIVTNYEVFFEVLISTKKKLLGS